MNSFLMIFTTIIFMFLTSCGPTLYGAFNDSGYKNTKYNYSVQIDAKTKSLLPDYWILDNFYEKSGRLLPKKGADYEATFYVDTDSDGKDDDIGEFYFYDLRYTHAQNAGVIWLRTMPMSEKRKQKELRIVARSYVESLAATHYETVQLEGKLYLTSSEKSFATTIVDRQKGTVAQQDAYAVVIDVANVNQLKLSPDSREKRVLIVFVRTPFMFEVRRQHSLMEYRHQLPVLMIAGYANLVEDFDEWSDDFRQFLARIVINGKKGASFEQVEEILEPLSTSIDEETSIENSPASQVETSTVSNLDEKGAIPEESSESEKSTEDLQGTE